MQYGAQPGTYRLMLAGRNEAASGMAAVFEAMTKVELPVNTKNSHADCKESVNRDRFAGVRRAASYAYLLESS